MISRILKQLIYVVTLSVTSFFVHPALNLVEAQSINLVVSVMNNDQQMSPIMSRVYIFPPSKGREIGTTDAAGTLKVSIRCDKVTKLQARPKSDAYAYSEIIDCHGKKKLLLRVSSIKILANLGANLIMLVKDGNFGAAALAANELRYFHLSSARNVWPMIAMGAVNARPMLDPKYAAVSYWDESKFSKRLISIASPDDFVRAVNPSQLLHPQYFAMLSKMYPIVEYSGLKVVPVANLEFRVPIGVHAEYLAYVYAAKALSVDYYPSYDYVQAKFVMSKQFKEVLKKFQKKNNLTHTGILDYRTLRLLGRKSSGELRHSVR